MHVNQQNEDERQEQAQLDAAERAQAIHIERHGKTARDHETADKHKQETFRRPAQGNLPAFHGHQRSFRRQESGGKRSAKTRKNSRVQGEHAQDDGRRRQNAQKSSPGKERNVEITLDISRKQQQKQNLQSDRRKK